MTETINPSLVCNRRLVWFRNDLRVHDNPALFHACELGEADSVGVMAVYVVCAEFFEKHFTAASRIHFIQSHLEVLSESLAKLKIPLALVAVQNVDQIVTALDNLVESEQINEVYLNAEYPFDEFERDKAVAFTLRSKGVKVKRFHDRVIIPPGMIRNQQGDPYKVFTPFKRAWFQLAKSLSLKPLPKPDALDTSNLGLWNLSDFSDSLKKTFSPFEKKDLSHYWKPGEVEAYSRFSFFIEHHLKDYDQVRDFPALDASSHLSPYLAIGSISPRQLLSGVVALNQGEMDTGQQGIVTWINELIWREFYQHVMVDFPRVCKFRPMQTHTEFFPWKKDEKIFKAWCEGRTGIPIVDAAMRQLNETGWMHNRLRMVVAMFLTKNLQIDWRMGEKYFMLQLIDGDFAANNGGWQWCASTGTDAAPYFRIFNPISQSEKFDAEGDFIRRYVPELKHLSAKQIHQPPLTANYPESIVDLSASRKSTIELFSKLR